MCGRFAITTPPEAMRGVFGYQAMPNFPPRYNIAPTQPIPVIRRPEGAGKDGHPQQHTTREFVLARWGLVPAWAKEIGSKPLINARSETAAQKPSFRGPFRHHRCLVPADGYYEWWRKGKGPPLPFYISQRDPGLFAMAAIWQSWMSPDGSELDTVALLTMPACESLEHIHHRMPCILAPDIWDDWMDPLGTSTKEASAMLTAPSDDFFKITRVSTAVNRVANNGPEIQEPFIEPEAIDEAPRLL